MVHVRVDEKTKQRAAKTLAGMGISVSDAVRMLLVRVAAKKGIAVRSERAQLRNREGVRAADRDKGKRLLPARSSRNWGSDRCGPRSAAPRCQRGGGHAWRSEVAPL
ncbi:MAG: type II toxin-antitoxin system RelB/DinJ family antitoxin [Bryobacteraceae bacterium]